MLQAFLEVLYEKDKTAAARAELVEAFKRLPNEELRKIAEGEVKLSFIETDSDWLEKYKGSPLFEQAIALEQEALQIDVQRKQKSMENEQVHNELRDALEPFDQQQSMLCLKKRMLDLELAKAQAGAPSGGEGMEELQEPEPTPAPAPQEGGTKVDVKTASGDAIQAIVEKKYPDLLKKKEKSKESCMDKKAMDEAVAAMRMSLEKEAFAGALGAALPAVTQGLKGAGNFLMGAGRQAVGAAQRGGMAGLGQNLARQATVGIGRAGQFAAKNPLAAGVIGAGALGTAALGGAAVG